MGATAEVAAPRVALTSVLLRASERSVNANSDVAKTESDIHISKLIVLKGFANQANATLLPISGEVVRLA